MGNFTFINAEENWESFINIFNSNTQFAPYTAKIDMNVVNGRLLPFLNDNNSVAKICLVDGDAQGIIHFSEYINWKEAKIGVIHMLFSNSYEAARELLNYAEEWFNIEGISRIETSINSINPYKYILHGAECYFWAGAYNSINAFNKADYNILLDIIAMELNLSDEPEIFYSDLENLEIVEKLEGEDEFAIYGKFEAKLDGEKIGECGYQFNKLISKQLNKGIGQISISAEDNFHGKGVGKSLITHSHNKLYNLGANKIILATNQSLFRAVKFYEKLGYKTEVIKGYWYCKNK